MTACRLAGTRICTTSSVRSSCRTDYREGPAFRGRPSCRARNLVFAISLRPLLALSSPANRRLFARISTQEPLPSSDMVPTSSNDSIASATPPSHTTSAIPSRQPINPSKGTPPYYVSSSALPGVHAFSRQPRIPMGPRSTIRPVRAAQRSRWAREGCVPPIARGDDRRVRRAARRSRATSRWQCWPRSRR